MFWNLAPLLALVLRLLFGIAADEIARDGGVIELGGVFFPGLQLHHVLHVAIGNRDHGGGRHGQESTDESKERGADDDGDQNNNWVQVHGLCLQPRREYIAFKLLDQNNEAQDQQCLGKAQRYQGDNHCERARDNGADERDEAGDEGNDRQGHRQGHADKHEAEADKDGIDKRDHRLRPNESAQGIPGAREQFREVPAGAPACGIAQPRQEFGAVLEEEEGEHQDNEHRDEK